MFLSCLSQKIPEWMQTNSHGLAWCAFNDLSIQRKYMIKANPISIVIGSTFMRGFSICRVQIIWEDSTFEV